MSTVHGFRVYQLFQSLRLHFLTDSYDYFKYQGKTKCREDHFNERPDRFTFHRLAKLYPLESDIELFLVANFLAKPKSTVFDLLGSDATEQYLHRRKVIESLAYTVGEDYRRLHAAYGSLNEWLKVPTHDSPPLLVAYRRQQVSLETVIVLNRLCGFLPRWTQQMTETIQWPVILRQITKYESFLVLEKEVYRTQLQTFLHGTTFIMHQVNNTI